MPLFFDAHCHVANDHDTASQVPPEPAVRGRILCGTGPEDWSAVAAADPAWPGTIPAFGLHPWYVGATDPASALAGLESLLNGHPGAWLGEAGLDGVRTDENSADAQEQAFTEQLRLADRLYRPVNLHCVKAYDRFQTLLDRHYLSAGARPFIIHSFAGPYQFVASLAERGAYFSVGQLQSCRPSRKNRERAALIPEDRLLLESDEPLIMGRDAPALLTQTLDWLAEVRAAAAAALADRIDNNVGRLLSNA